MKRQIKRAFVDHIAMPPNPAYQGAEVIAVRSTAPATELFAPRPTPRLDEVLRWLENR